MPALTRITALTAVAADALLDAHAVPVDDADGGTRRASLAQLRTQIGLPVFNVRATPYGAVGDGTTNDSAAFNAAIVAANAAGGGIVYVPAGTYRLVTTATLLSNVHLEGEGPTSLLVGASTGMHVLTVGADQTRGSIRQLAITGAAATGVLVTHAAIFFPQSTSGGYWEVEDLYVPVRSNRGVSAFVKIEPNNPHITIRRFRVEGLYGHPASTGYGVLVTSDYVTIEDGVLTPPAGEGRNAVYLSGTATTGITGALVRNVRTIGFTNVPFTAHAGGPGVTHSAFTNCRSEGMAGGDDSFAAFGVYGAFDDLLFDGCVADLRTTAGIANGFIVTAAVDIDVYTRGRGARIRGCTVVDPTGAGLVIDGDTANAVAQYPSDLVVENLRVQGASRSGAGTYSGIKVQRADNVTVNGAQIDGATGTTLHGVFCSPATPLGTNTVVTNVVARAVAGSAVVTNANTVTGLVVLDGVVIP
jgi:hypothetical protein